MNNFEIPLEIIVEAAESANIDPDNIRGDYSGRGMYGSTCFGVIVANMSEFLRFMLEIERTDCGFDYTNYLADWVNQDSMGYDTIYYFPGVKLVD